MKPEDILRHPARVLTQDQREAYFRDGYLVVERLIPEDVVDEINRITAGWIDRSRAITAPNDVLDVAPSHSAEKPVVRRLKKPDGMDPAYWDYANGVIADVAADLLGPDVCFHHSKLNFKWSDGHDEVAWHQDIAFYPHTNYSLLAIGTYLADVNPGDGPLGVIPGSHKGPIFEHYDDNDIWTGRIKDDAVAELPTETAVYCPAPKGSITIHHARAVHATEATTHSVSGRPLLINAFASADAFPYAALKSTYTEHFRTLVRGTPARWAHHDPEPCPTPPDFSAGYTSIYAQQAGEPGTPTPRDPGHRPEAAIKAALKSAAE
ncbi:MAG: phytanoyl-CoA dioxygenase [Rhodospirillaceae bacterium]|nr:phytanoyl-CoA dioxygenase [Rhodospirillaceae bacterium]